MRRRRRIRRTVSSPSDYFGTQIEVGDRFYCGNPCQAGTVIKIRTTSIVIAYGEEDWSSPRNRWVSMTMNIKSPGQGVCLDKVPEELS